MPHTNYHNGRPIGVLQSSTSLSFYSKQDDAGTTAQGVYIEGGMLAKYAVKAENLHLPQLFLPEGKAAHAICPLQVANNDSSCGVTPEKVVQEVSLIFSCCVPDLQAESAQRATTIR